MKNEMSSYQSISSRFNPLLEVKKNFFGPKLFSGGLIQSGGVIKQIWAPIVKLLSGSRRQRVLVLGMGGGTLVQLLKKNNLGVEITAVEIDKEVIKIAREFFKIEDWNFKIINEDAISFVRKDEGRYDLIFVDLYRGDKFPKEAKTRVFLNSVSKLLGQNGFVVFNRLYWGSYKKEADEFEGYLGKHFRIVKAKTVPRFFATNKMFIASNTGSI